MKTVTKGNPKRLDPAKRKTSRVLVYPHSSIPHRALIRCGGLVLQCTIGRNGVTRHKREGDWSTPAGSLRLLYLIVRSDRVVGPNTQERRHIMRASHIWDENPRNGTYNRLLIGGLGWPGDWIWRSDRLYNVIGVLDWNITSRGSYRGSAIFLHLCRPDYGPTAGCIALEPNDLKRLLARISKHATFVVDPVPRKLARQNSNRT